MHTRILAAAVLLLGWSDVSRQDPNPEPGSTNTAPQGAPVEPSAPKAQEAASAPAAYEVRYHTLDEVVALVKGWIASAKPDRALVEPVDLPATRTALPVPALAFGAPGQRPLVERPTVLILGGLDGVSLAGSE